MAAVITRRAVLGFLAVLPFFKPRPRRDVYRDTYSNTY